MPATKSALIVIPFATSPNDWRLMATTAALDSQGLVYRLEDTSQSDTAYFELMRSLWEAQRTVLIIEQDIIVWPGLVQELLACPNLWCAVPYAILGDYGTALGCTKFSQTLIELLPDLPEEADKLPPATFVDIRTDEEVELPATHWWVQDQAWTGLLKGLGFEPHVHLPAVTHLNTQYHATKENKVPPRKYLTSS